MSVGVVVPGSFDPVTLGHLDVITRASERFGRVVVAVVANPGKQPLFDLDERLEMLVAETSMLEGVRVVAFDGLLVDLCSREDVGIICKGLRGVADFEYERQMAQMNLDMAGVETVFVSTRPQLAHLSSSLVKEVARLGGPVDAAVPPRVADALRARLGAGGVGA